MTTKEAPTVVGKRGVYDKEAPTVVVVPTEGSAAGTAAATRCSYPKCPVTLSIDPGLLPCGASGCGAFLHHLCMATPGARYEQYAETSSQRLCLAHLKALLTTWNP